MLDPGNPLAKNLIIDNLPLDYSILDEIEYEYPTGRAYFNNMPQVLSLQSRELLSHYSIKREDAELYTKKDINYKQRV